MIPTGQETEPFDDNIEKYGCYLFSILRSIELRTAHRFDNVSIVNSLYKDFVANGWIRRDCLILDAAAIFNHFGLRVSQLTFSFDPNNKYVADPRYAAAPDEIEILCFYWPEKGYMHFVLGDGQGGVAYDPISRGSNTVKYGVLHSKRIFKVLT